MSIQAWASPPVQVAQSSGSLAWNAKAAQYCTRYVNFFPSKSDGTPASAWIFTVGSSSDWTAANADAQLTSVFAGPFPATVVDQPTLISFLRSNTVSMIPAARLTQIQANLDALSIVRSDFTSTTPLWLVFKRVVSTALEKDDAFGSGFMIS